MVKQVATTRRHINGTGGDRPFAREVIRIVLGSILFSMVVTCVASAQPAIGRNVAGGGGGTMSNGTLRVLATIGQPTIGLSSSSLHALHAGFWVPFAPTGVSTVNDEVVTRGSSVLAAHHALVPNPASMRATLHGTMSTPGNPAIRVHDVLGREVRSIDGGWRDSGTYEVAIDVSELAAGRYIVTMSDGDTRRSVTLQVAR